MQAQHAASLEQASDTIIASIKGAPAPQPQAPAPAHAMLQVKYRNCRDRSEAALE
jgi:hypothetical protein